jgi:hypothetical protein
MGLDWQSIEDRLFEWSQQSILRFAQEHPEVCCSFFACKADVAYGSFSLNFDTEEQAFEAAQEYERAARGERYVSLSDEGSWRIARMILTIPILTTHGREASYFTYPEYDSIVFDELSVGINREAEPEIAPLLKEGYLEGNVYRVLWKLSERLVASSVFDHLSQASPFFVGSQLQGEVLVVLRILNWPTGSR